MDRSRTDGLRPTGNAWQKLCAVLGLFVLGLLCSFSFREFKAEILSLEADSVLKGWRDQGVPPSKADWLKTRDLLKSARDWSGDSPVFLERLGYWHSAELISRVGVVVDPKVAVEYQRKALVGRPTSAYTWANLAQTKYLAGEIDKEFYAALQHASRLGPWEPWVQVTIVDLGLALWDEAQKDVRELTLAALERGMYRQGSEMMKLIHKRGRLSQICESVLSHNVRKLACQ